MASAFEESVSQPAKKVFTQISRALKKLPDIDFGVDDKNLVILMTSHVLARAVANVFGGSVVDGLFLGMYDHSWIEIIDPKKPKKKCIIDVLPIGILKRPLFVSASKKLTPGRLMYKAKPAHYGKDFERKTFLKLVKIAEKKLKKVVKK